MFTAESCTRNCTRLYHSSRKFSADGYSCIISEGTPTNRSHRWRGVNIQLSTRKYQQQRKISKNIFQNRVTICPISELTGEGTFSFTCLSFIDERVCTFSIAYPFIKHVPVVIVMSISYFSNCAMMCHSGKATRFHLFHSVCFAFPGLAWSEK